MSERWKQLEACAVRESWDASRVETALRGLHRKRRRRATLKLTAGALGAAALVTGVALQWNPSGSPPEKELAQAPAAMRPSSPPAAERPLRLRDGSLATALSAQSELIVVEESATRISLELLRGRAQFEVAPVPSRLFRVRAGKVSVVVVGTAFTVERSPEGVGVFVTRGRVRVEGPAGAQELAEGDHDWFSENGKAPVSRPRPAAAPKVSPQDPKDWRPLAEQGKLSEAYELLQAVPAGAAAHTVEDLLLAADTSRLSGHPGEAVPFLERLVRDHPGDPRAPLAAFTLGKVLLNPLGRFEEAAAAFAEARALSPQSNLAQDALAREVESYSRAGQLEQAGERAREYLRAYPEGPRRGAVRHFGGLGP